MDILNKYKAVIAIILIVLILIFIRFLSPGHFKPDAKRWAAPSVNQSNIVTVKEFETLHGKKLIINLDKDNSKIGNISRDANNIDQTLFLIRKILIL